MQGEEGREGLVSRQDRLEGKERQEEGSEDQQVPDGHENTGRPGRNLEPEPADGPRHPLGGPERTGIETVEVSPVEDRREEEPRQQEVQGQAGPGIREEP